VSTDPDCGRLTVFGGVLVLSGTLLFVATELIGMSRVALAPVYMFSPLVAGLTVCYRYDVAPSTVGFRVGRPRWLVVSILITPLLVGLTLVVAVAFPGVGLDTSADPMPGVTFSGALVTVGFAIVAGVTINALLAFGEEFGWRGYLLWELAPLGFWRGSGVIGAVWGVWHAPLVLAGHNYPSFPVAGIVAMTVACIAFSPVYTYLVLRADSVFAAVFFHGVFNGFAGIVPVYTAADTLVLSELVASPVGMAGIVAFLSATVGIALRGAPEPDQRSAGSWG